jgi:hypothetical protein
MNICSGHPYSDIARTIYLIEMTPMPEHVDPTEFTMLRRRITDTYLLSFPLTGRKLTGGCL